MEPAISMYEAHECGCGTEVSYCQCCQQPLAARPARGALELGDLAAIDIYAIPPPGED